MATDVVIIFDAYGRFNGIYADEEINVIKVDYGERKDQVLMPDGFFANISRVPVTEDVSYTTEMFDTLETYEENKKEKWDDFS